ncbi:SoxR reducing system RseC family protein [Marinobacterium lutimaris]|uniref:Positive regulator of sigma(E), RseC/MucC n=1 Tax=Marinobacterium lutimaris TaxID=568106 RepID=A0A1H6CIG2_9GAMM|nr:SoxR reducing system RseC family protein [Marinobacterium lutimaris]SEG72770.1 positive regulator of sigma(E), RseC/MucC [Marinobacterium lutimaris]
MIEEVVQVSRIEGEEIWIEASRQSACAACSAKKSCGQGALSDWMSGKAVELTVLNPNRVLPQVGQSVVIGLEEGSLIKASVMVYFLPLLALILASVATRIIGGSENVQILAGLVGLVVGFVFARWISTRKSSEGCYQPVLLRLVS